jgi:predicted phage terminase large subunit-like protein
VCTTWGLFEKKRYLIDVLRKRFIYPDLKRAIVEHANLHRPNVILIEDKASGTQLIPDLRRDGLSNITAILPKDGKIMRMNTQSAQFEGGFVVLPVKAPWLDAYVSELTSFPKGKFDDQVDSTSQALAWIQEEGDMDGIFLHYKKMYEKNTGKVR